MMPGTSTTLTCQCGDYRAHRHAGLVTIRYGRIVMSSRLVGTGLKDVLVYVYVAAEPHLNVAYTFFAVGSDSNSSAG